MNPITEIDVKDFTAGWDKKSKEKKTTDELFGCSFGDTANTVAQGYWYGFKGGCICNGDFGGEYQDGKFDPFGNATIATMSGIPIMRELMRSNK